MITRNPSNDFYQIAEGNLTRRTGNSLKIENNMGSNHTYEHFCIWWRYLFASEWTFLPLLEQTIAKKKITSKNEHFYLPFRQDWSVSAPYSHLAGGMTYKDGKLTLPTTGRYYIYAQIYYHNRGRVHVRVNNKIVTMTQPPVKGTDIRCRGVQPEGWWRHHVGCELISSQWRQSLHVELPLLLWRVPDLSIRSCITTKRRTVTAPKPPLIKGM